MTPILLSTPLSSLSSILFLNHSLVFNQTEISIDTSGDAKRRKEKGNIKIHPTRGRVESTLHFLPVEYVRGGGEDD